MRKKLIEPIRQQSPALEHHWLSLEDLAEVELTSEDVAHPIESALLGTASGWRAAAPGEQSIRLLFDHPQAIRLIHLHFVESEIERTQEYVLRWSPDGGQSFHEIVRQQWNFSPSGVHEEIENYQVDLAQVTVLELRIKPDIGHQGACASLRQWRLA
jgi:hypothetical protein